MGERNGLERKARSTTAEEEDEGGWCLAGEEDVVLMEDERRLKATEEVETWKDRDRTEEAEKVSFYKGKGEMWHICVPPTSRLRSLRSRGRAKEMERTDAFPRRQTRRTHDGRKDGSRVDPLRSLHPGLPSEPPAQTRPLPTRTRPHVGWEQAGEGRSLEAAKLPGGREELKGCVNRGRGCVVGGWRRAAGWGLAWLGRGRGEARWQGEAGRGRRRGQVREQHRVSL